MRVCTFPYFFFSFHVHQFAGHEVSIQMIFLMVVIINIENLENTEKSKLK